ncbi:MAG: hypothetical protein JWR01_1822 [Subtercola sp.]|nr:hypothetical protein [Subtercola sp.]
MDAVKVTHGPKATHGPKVTHTAENIDPDAIAPLWMRRPGLLHLVAYGIAVLVFSAQLVGLGAKGSDLTTVLAVVIAGAGVALSWWMPWAGLIVTSAATFGVTAVGQDPLSVWMMAVIVLFSFTLRGYQPVVGTIIVAGFFLAAFMTVGGFTGGVIVGCAALFSAIAGGASGAALRIHRDLWKLMEERARRVVELREIEATRRIAEERVRIARDLHDVVGHQVAMLSVYLGVAEIGLPPDAESSRQALVAARASARNVVVETQGILALLRRGDSIPAEEALQPTPSLAGLDALVGSFEGIGLVVHSAVDVSADAAQPSVGVTVYRLVQEALTNAYRHGEGAASVIVGEEDGQIHVIVENQIGHARSGPVAGSGLGLIGMRERVESCGGRLAITSDDGTFRVEAEFSRVGSVFA